MGWRQRIGIHRLLIFSPQNFETKISFFLFPKKFTLDFISPNQASIRLHLHLPKALGNQRPKHTHARIYFLWFLKSPASLETNFEWIYFSAVFLLQFL
ncbi:hypothetical protein ES332_D10G155500v1 [Gossypium tomentosum]|uniref:Uncharacterized protein n=1 Tax=Gossypium tomentosum TaxID=34277 RepID=A0A5D2J629_GOSTO|nr:hypothetical protein ES332_D10G155500v1 [Gossypium tomentosum]